jgi:DNA-binding transcriptional MerR regulator
MSVTQIDVTPNADTMSCMAVTDQALTIDELARETGMTVRNIRAHQSRGLVPPPEVRARTGYYGPEHIARIRLIQEMQADGFNLRAIHRLLEGAAGAADQALGFKRAVLAPFTEEEPEYVTREELDARLGGPLDAKLLRKAERLGLLRAVDGDRYEVPSPTLLRAGEELVGLGVPMGHVLAVAERINRHSRAIAEAFVRLFVDDVLVPLERDGTVGPEHWERVREAVERLRPLASEALLAGFHQTMTATVERRFDQALGR